MQERSPSLFGLLGCALIILPWLLVGLDAMAPSPARAACTPDPPTADGDVITCSGVDSTGFDGSGFDDLTVDVLPDSELDDSNPGLDAALLLGEGNTVTFGSGSLLRVGEDGGAGIRGGDDNEITLNGVLRILGDDAQGVSIGSRTAAERPGQIVLEATSDETTALVEVVGDRSVGLQAGDDVGVRNAGEIVVEGIDAIGIDVGDRTELGFESLIEHSGRIEVLGTGGIGLRAGDGWLANDVNAAPGELSTPTGTGIVLFPGSTIDVLGANAFGLFVGDESNTAGNHNSLVTVAGSITVSGVDAIGLSLGGNDLIDDPTESVALETSLLESGTVAPDAALSLFHQGSITGSPDAGPLVRVRDFASGDNRIGIAVGAELVADLTSQGSPDRAIALRGSDGVEVVINFGDVTGDVQLRDGDDRFVQSSTGSFTGVLDGGNGDDALLLAASSGGAGSFDLSQLVDIETLRIGGGDGWTLANGGGFGGRTRIEAGGRLIASSATALGGDLEIDPTGTLEVFLASDTPALTVAGSAALAGRLVLEADEDLTASPTPFRVVLAGSRSGEFDEIDFAGASGIRRFTPLYDASGLSVLLEILPLSALARGANNRAVVNHLVAIGDSGAGSTDVRDFFGILGELSVGQANGAFDALSPEAYDAQTTVVAEGGRRVARLLLDRPRECVEGRLDPWTAARAPLPCHPRTWSPWLAGIGGFRSRDGFAGHPSYDANLGGLVVGVDVRPTEGLDLTFALASQRGSLSVGGAGNSTLTLTDLAGHAAWSQGPLRVQTVVSWGHGFHDDKRRIRFVSEPDGTTTDLRGTTDHDSDRLTLAGEVGVRLDAGAIRVEPLVTVDWAWISQRGFEEAEAGGFGLRVEDRRDAIGSVAAGVRLETIYHHDRYLGRSLLWMDGVWRPQIDLRWRQILSGTEREIDARLQGAPAGVSDFTIEGKEDDGGLELGAGLSFVPKDANRLQFNLRYETFIASHTLEQNLTARVLIGF